MAVNRKKHIALVDCGAESYRGYLLEQLSEEYRVTLIMDEPCTWQKPLIQDYIQIEKYTAESIYEALFKEEDDDPVQGVVCWDEKNVIAAADAASLLNLRTAGGAGIRGCRDKAHCRRALTEHGVLQPGSEFCSTEDDALAFARAHRYPLIVKPRGMGGSIGVAKVDSDSELLKRFNQACELSLTGEVEFRNGALVEEFVVGPEISIDCAVVDGQTFPLFVGRKRIGEPPYFEEIGHSVSYDDPLLIDKDIQKTLAKAHSAIKFENGVTHTELKITSSGFVIIEINGRLGGDLIPLLATHATGIKPGAIAGNVACGDFDTQTSFPVRKVAAVEFKYPDHKCVVDEVLMPMPKKTSDMNSHSISLASVGTRLALPPAAFMSRASYSMVVGDDAQACSVEAIKLCAETKIIAMEAEKAATVKDPMASCCCG